MSSAVITPSTSKAKAGSGRLARWFAAASPAIFLSVATLIVWELISRVFQLPEFVLPAPSSIGKIFITRQGALMQAAWVTAEEILYGFILSTLVGMLIAVAIARFERMGRAVYPLMVLFQNVPKIALAPLFILWFGYDLAPKILLIVVMAFFPVALNMLVGLQAADPNLVTLMRTVGASRTEILWRVQIPHSLPSLMSGIKIAITLSVIGAIVGEFAGASAGLGYLIQFASTQMETALVFAALIQISLLGMFFYYAVEIIESKYIYWTPKI
ncbi:NitT/TauT family transport system permease protein [Polaromonas sp. OV174]|uniref:ABC transporter permease n=1 Tax=Polaromonas sp. OV174 TaxID=1855300 RepID=UPI0008F29B48|nr:ABC transporter permease [Polaromonas sp. OV174]SFC73752.1 NitT/TauT family transport system permease protein [Polaromonas sp. OV174]